MDKNEHLLSLSPEWQKVIADEIGGQFFNDKIILLPEKMGKGHFFFMNVIPGISLVLLDFVLSAPLKLRRITDKVERYIFHFDLSDQANLIQLCNVDYKIGYAENLGLAIFNNQAESSFEASAGTRTFALRLFVDIELMNDFIKNSPIEIKTTREINIIKESLFYSNSFDSNSILLILSIKKKLAFDESFAPFIKGIALKLLGNFLNSYSKPTAVKNQISEIENKKIIETKNYLLDNLYNQFPSIPFLSKMAGMSSSKFKSLFKKRFNETPKNIFIQEKMVLANKLLQSGDFTTLTEVINELDYVKLDYFSSKYFDIFHRKPFEDFVKKRKP
jgi:AraC-like DNA-binding protein